MALVVTEDLNARILIDYCRRLSTKMAPCAVGISGHLGGLVDFSTQQIRKVKIGYVDIWINRSIIARGQIMISNRLNV